MVHIWVIIFVLKICHELAIFEAKRSLQKQIVQPKLQTFFSNVFWLCLNGRSNNYFTPYMGESGFFLSVKFATSPLTLLAGG